MSTRWRRGATAVVIIALTSGCSEKRPHVFTGADARRLAALPPSTSGWRWPQSDVKPVWDTSAESSTSDPLLARFRRKTATQRSLGEASKEWQDTDKLASLVVDVYQTSSAAHAVMASFNELSEGLAERSGRIRKVGQADHLGDEAWVMSVTGNGAQVTYHWRRDNLLFETHVHCFGTCRSDIDAATRAWANRIDIATRTRPCEIACASVPE